MFDEGLLYVEQAYQRVRDLRASPVYLPSEPDFGEEGGDFDSYLAELSAKFAEVMDEHPQPCKPSVSKSIFGAEVGDDRKDISEHYGTAVSVLVHQEVTVGMVTSSADTMISRELSNFCEATTILPSSKNQLYNACRKRGDFANMQFADSPALRTVIDTTKVTNLHSTSSVGKASMLGAKMRSSNQTCRAFLNVANLLQDGMLRTAKSPEPKYMPSTLGGCNCPAPYEDPVNTYLYMKTFKGGGYDRLYGTATAEAKEAIRLTESGKPTSIILSKLLRDNDELAFGTFDRYLAIPKPAQIETVQGLPTPLYEAGGVVNNLASAENRLRNARQLVTRTEAKTLLNRKLLIEEFILTNCNIAGVEEVRRTERLRARGVVGDAIFGHSAFMRLARREGCLDDITKLIRTGWGVCVTGQPEFSLEHAEWLHQGAKGDVLSLIDLPHDEDMFLRSEVSGDESMMISGIPLHVLGKEKFLTQVTKSQVGLYQINGDMLQWAEDLTDRLKEHPMRPIPHGDVITLFSENREWVNDDSTLIRMAIDDFANLGKNSEAALISKDKRLANQMSKQANIRVVLVDPESIVQAFDKTWSSTTKVTPLEMFSAYGEYDKSIQGLKIPHKVYLDTGSILASLSRLEAAEEGGMKKIFRITPVRSGIRENGTRYEVYDREELPYRKTVRVRVYDNSFLTHGNRKKPTSYSGSSASDRYDWSKSAVSFDDYVTRRSLQYRLKTSQGSDDTR